MSGFESFEQKRYLALNASAGSGKTFALSVRFVALILMGADISRILALTFTKKAAGEMQWRITQLFTGLHRDDFSAQRAEIARILGVGEQWLIDRRDEMMEQFLSSELKIGTFDSFFGGIFRQFALNLGIMPDSDSAADIDYNEVKEEFIRELKKENLFKQFVEYASELKEAPGGILSELKRFFESGVSEAEILNSIGANSVATNVDKSGISASLEALRDYVKSVWGERLNEILEIESDGKKPPKNWASKKDLKSLLGSVDIKDKSIAKLVKTSIARDLNEPCFTKTGASEDGEFLRLRQNLLAALVEYEDGLERFKLANLAGFLRAYDRARSLATRRLNKVSFADVTHEVARLLKQDGVRDLLYFRLDARINHILIDEFQDTNSEQYSIMLPLIAEAVSGEAQGGVGSFFYVGDVKQSIYRFRGGQKELFGALAGEFKQIKNESLEHNFRSAKGIVEFVNSLFADKFISTNELSGEAKNSYIAQKPASKTTGYVEVSGFSGDGVVPKEAAYQKIYEKILFLQSRGAKLDDIAVLMWKNEHLKELKEFLYGFGIEVASAKVAGLVDTASVRLVLEALKGALFQNGYYGYLLGEFGLKTSVKLPDLNRPICEILRAVATELGLDSASENLLKLYEISAEFSDIYELVFALENRDDEAANSQSSGVKLLSVHKSKGLEFKHAIVCDRLGKDGTRKSGFIAEFDAPNKRWEVRLRRKFCFEGLKEYKELLKKEELLERENTINALYVALTRAKNSLIILINNGKLHGNNPSYFKAYESAGKMVEYLDLEPKIYFDGEISGDGDDNAAGADILSGGETLIFERVNRQTPNPSSDMDEMQNEPNIADLHFGSALHYCLEMLGGFEGRFLDNAMMATKNRFGSLIGGDGLESVRKRVLALLENGEFLELIRGKKIYKEQSFGTQKRFDLLAIGDDEVVVVDYKSAKNSQYNNKYKEQIIGYKTALQGLFVGRKILARLIFLGADEVQIESV